MSTLKHAVAIADACSEECPNPGCTGRAVSMRTGTPTLWQCYRCGHPIQVSPTRSSAETKVLELIAKNDEVPPDKKHELFRRGVTVRLLNKFTEEFQCWGWPTWQVVRDVVLPATAASHGRYFDILEEANPGECGAPSTFISHAWGAKWGTLVGVASYGSYDGDRRVWIDIFAVRQWPGSPMDLNFDAVINRCGSLLLAISHEVLEEARLGDRDDILRGRITGSSVSTLFDAAVRQKLPLARSWCLAELVAAYRAGRNVAAVAGEFVADTTSSVSSSSALKQRSLKLAVMETVSGQWLPARQFAVSSFGLVEALADLVRMEDAEASSDVDRNRIHADIQSSIGFLEFNASVHVALLSSSVDPPEAHVVLPLMCDNDYKPLCRRAAQAADKARLLATLAGVGLEESVAMLIDEFGYDYEDGSMPALWKACSSGHLPVATMLVDKYHARIEGRAGNGMTPLAAAAGGGHADVVRFLLDRGAHVDARARLNRSAMTVAAINGHTHILAILKEAGSSVDLVDNNGQTALTHAINGLHTDAARFLVTACAADINLQTDPERYSPLHLAAARGSLDMAKTLIDKGARVEAQALDGTTPLMMAAINGHPDTLMLLVQAGADVGATNDVG